jgi:hypothetical protein
MRVLLQNTETKLYFIDSNEWTDDPLKATNFEHVDYAAYVYQTEDLAYARIIIEPGPPAQVPQRLSDLLRQVQAQG